MHYDCVIVGGGIAGLQAAIQLGRYERSVLVIDAKGGRSAVCRCYRNLLGWPQGVSGDELRRLGREHARDYGVLFVDDEVTDAYSDGENGFRLHLKQSSSTVQAKRMLLATGIEDRWPPFPELLPCLGLTVYICPDCDGYEVKNRSTVVLGAGAAGAHMARVLSYWTKNLTYVNYEQEALSESTRLKLEQKGIEYYEEPLATVHVQDSEKFAGVTLQSGKHIQAERAFLAPGQPQVQSDLAKKLGVERLENKHLHTDPRTKMTNVKHVWAAGDVVAHSQQVAIAMGEGVQAAIWMQKSFFE
jgi:thioredoxin reductase (NADPH)